MQIFQGIAVSPGVAIGPALVLESRAPRFTTRAIPRKSIESEDQRLRKAIADARDEVEAAANDIGDRLGQHYADILSAHVRMIADPTLLREASNLIRDDLVSAEHAVFNVLDGYARQLEQLGINHLADRAADVRDILRRILDQLMGQPQPPPSPPGDSVEPTILLAEDISPGDAAALDPNRVIGFATEFGGQTSHTAIVAAALEIPAVVGVGRFLSHARAARTAIIDGYSGTVVLDPDPPTLEQYRQLAVDTAERFEELGQFANLSSETSDGVRIGLFGNIEFPDEVKACRNRGADGVGLFRTEFLYLTRSEPPTEEEQTEAYASVIRALDGRPVTIRTLDLGSDKAEDYSSVAEPNPALGLRSIRRSLREPGPFRSQLRAILRAARFGEVRLMFPLVTTLAEFREARKILQEVASELEAEEIPHRSDLPVGVMIEVPAAALLSDLLAKEVDFFSIGTNDLTQYTLAADRTNRVVADLYNPAEPAVIRLIDLVVRSAINAGIEVTVCGSIAGEPLYTMLLIGLGVHHLSTPPHQLPEVKRVIRAARLDEARNVAKAALEADSGRRVLALLEQAYQRILPD